MDNSEKIAKALLSLKDIHIPDKSFNPIFPIPEGIIYLSICILCILLVLILLKLRQKLYISITIDKINQIYGELLSDKDIIKFAARISIIIRKAIIKIKGKKYSSIKADDWLMELNNLRVIDLNNNELVTLIDVIPYIKSATYAEYDKASFILKNNLIDWLKRQK